MRPSKATEERARRHTRPQKGKIRSFWWCFSQERRGALAYPIPCTTAPRCRHCGNSCAKNPRHHATHPAGSYVVTVDTASVPHDCSVPLCPITVPVTLAAGQIFLNADFCFTPPPSGPGTGTPGYWMNHPEAWPVDSITIGGITYSKAQAIAMMKLPVSKDKRLTMFPNLVCAKLNVLIGTESSCIAATIAAADAWWATYSAAPVAANSAAWAVGGPLATTLDNYNNGLMCAPHRN